jgi:hypothetical protein
MRFRFHFRIRWRFHHFHDGPQSDFHSPNERNLKQISPDKNVNFRYTTAAFTLSPESGASLCCANSPGDWALYAVSVRRLIALRSGLPLPLVALACGSPCASLQPFRPFLTETPLPSANVYIRVSRRWIGFTHRGLSPHKFTPMPGVHNSFNSDWLLRCATRPAG